MIPSIHRPTKIVVDCDHITDNIKTIKQHLPKETQIFAVVKANAYGHGAKEVARATEKNVDAFCVSNLDEALELRQAGVAKPILILGVVMPEAVSLAVENDIILTVASLEWVEGVEKLDAIKGLSVHIKVDSGMGRIGFRDSDSINEAMTRLRKLGASVDGIFTHFATADEADTLQFDEQLETFKVILDQLDSCPPLVHASNSATSLWHADTVFNAVRLGLAMYGLNPSGRELELPYDLSPALRIESEINHVKRLPAGSFVGYGATYHTTKAEVIATVPIGYADGYTRDMQGFHVLVDGNLCEVVGRVSMDQITIRLPKVYPMGTPVTLMGEDKGATISATDIAGYRKTINYEVLCLLSDRIPREYKGQ